MQLFKVNENIWQELIYLINNFFFPCAYTKGRDVYPDRVTLVRSKDANFLFDPTDTKQVEYFILNARSKETNKTEILHKREVVERVVTDSLFVNQGFNQENQRGEYHDYASLFDYVQKVLTTSEICDYQKLNNFILEAYKKLDIDDAIKFASFRENAINKCLRNGFFSAEFAEEQINKFPNSTLKLQANLKIKDK